MKSTAKKPKKPMSAVLTVRAESPVKTTVRTDKISASSASDLRASATKRKV